MSTGGYNLSGGAVAKLAADHRRLEQQPYNRPAPPAWRLDDGDFEAPIYFINSGGSTIDPYSLLAVTGMDTNAASESIYAVGQPTSAAALIYLVNNDDQVQSGSIGIAQRGPIVRFAFDTGTPALGDVWGPKASQWTASKGTTPAILRAAGTFQEYGNTYGYGWQVAPSPRTCYGTLSGSLSAGGSVSCSATACMDGTAAPGTITIYDEIYGSLTGSSGNQFTAIENFATGHWAFLGIICGG